MSNYDTTNYEEKRTHGPDEGPEPEPGTPAFGDRARLRHARLMEAAINSVRPKPSDLGTGTASQAAGALKRRRESIEDAAKE